MNRSSALEKLLTTMPPLKHDITGVSPMMEWLLEKKEVRDIIYWKVANSRCTQFDRETGIWSGCAPVTKTALKKKFPSSRPGRPKLIEDDEVVKMINRIGGSRNIYGWGKILAEHIGITSKGGCGIINRMVLASVLSIGEDKMITAPVRVVPGVETIDVD